MERAEHHVAGFGGFDGGVDRFQVAHFAHEDHVRVHPQRPADAFLEVVDVHADLTLVDSTLLVFVKVLDGVFEGDDVAVVVVVDEVDHRRQARRLAGTCRPGHQQQTPWTDDERAYRLGHPQLFKGEELERNPPQHHADGATLLEHGHPEAVTVDIFDGEVGPALLLQLLLAAVRCDRLHQPGGVVRRQDLGIELPHPSAGPHHGGLADADMQVARLDLDDSGEQLLHGD